MSIEKLKQQILAQGTTSQWSGEGFGSAEKNAEDMAKILSGIGITDIRQFGKVDKYEPVDVIGYSFDGMRVQNPRPGQYYAEVPMEDGEGGVYFSRRDLSPEEAKQVKPVYGVVSGYDEYNQPTYTPVDATKVTQKDGQLVGVTGTSFGNKETGQVVPNTYGERQTNNAWGGTYAGSGNTGYRVEFAEDGTPYFYTTAASSRDGIVDFALQAGSLALMAVPGVGAAVGSAVAAGASTATQLVIGNALVQGTLSEAMGGDFVKGAVAGGIGAYASGFTQPISQAAGGGMVGAAAGQAAVSGITAAVTGGDVGKAVMGGAIGGAINYSPQTSSPFDMAEFAAADAMQLMQQGIGVSAVEQNLVASGLDPLVAADITQRISLNPNLTSKDLAGQLINTYGNKIYDMSIDEINKAAEEKIAKGKAQEESKLSAKDAARFLKTALGVATAGTVIDQVLDIESGADLTKLNYGDIYKDAPIKGFSMQKMQDELGATKYMPKIGEKELLAFEDSFKPVTMAKGGFVKRRS